MIYNVIEEKIIDYAEIVVILFDHCNLNCVFCPQDHKDDSTATYESIMSKSYSVFNWINNNNRTSYFKVHIMGGELFQDRFVDRKFLEIYQSFINAIIQNTTASKTIVPNFVTNLVFNRVEEVYNFIDMNNLKISISYDIKGRFNKDQRDLFEKNVEYFKDKIEMVSIQMTKQNINAFLEGDSYFDYLYDNFGIDWDSFIPTKEISISPSLMPSESDKLKLYKLLINKYPKCYNIEHFVNKKENNKMTCTRGNNLTILKTGKIPKGCSSTPFIEDSDLNVVENWLSRHNCFSCEYYRRCPLTCFISANYKHTVRDLDTCYLKEAFKYADSLY